MLKKLRRRFVLSAMAAIFVVMTILMMAVNGVNYTITMARLDDTLRRISGSGDDQDSPFQKPAFPQPDMKEGEQPPLEGIALFFTIECTDEGEIVSVKDDFFSSISDQAAEEYVEAIRGKNRQLGYYGGYRYLVTEQDETVRITFLEAGAELQSVRTILLVSCGVEVFCLLAVFCLVSVFSGKAIGPYIKNIERQKQFITDAGHEIKTPLTSIATSADVLAMEYEKNEWVENIQKQSARMSKLVNNLVTLSRLDEERPLPTPAEFNLSDAVWEISEPFAAMARAKGKSFEQRIEDDVMFRGDRALMQQMISILLDNAVKYSDEGGRIWLTVQKRHKGVAIQVSNTCDLSGIGDINRLFDRFYRPDKSRNTKTGGTGIGLSIARAAALAHHGKLTVSSRDGNMIIFRAAF